MRKLHYVLLSFVLLLSYQCTSGKRDFENGDIIFQTSKSDQSKAIQIATKSKYSHMGIIYKMNDEVFVYEAIQPIMLTRLEDWIERGEKEHYVVKRLKNSEEILTPEKLLKMEAVGKKYFAKDYDPYFEWSDSRIYCSELVWKIYKEALDIEIGALEELGSFDLTNEAVQKKMKERYGDNIPKDELVISPGAMFNSEKLKTVYKN